MAPNVKHLFFAVPEHSSTNVTIAWQAAIATLLGQAKKKVLNSLGNKHWGPLYEKTTKLPNFQVPSSAQVRAWALNGLRAAARNAIRDSDGAEEVRVNKLQLPNFKNKPVGQTRKYVPKAASQRHVVAENAVPDELLEEERVRATMRTIGIAANALVNREGQTVDEAVGTVLTNMLTGVTTTPA